MENSHCLQDLDAVLRRAELHIIAISEIFNKPFAAYTSCIMKMENTSFGHPLHDLIYWVFVDKRLRVEKVHRRSISAWVQNAPFNGFFFHSQKNFIGSLLFWVEINVPSGSDRLLCCDYVIAHFFIVCWQKHVYKVHWKLLYPVLWHHKNYFQLISYHKSNCAENLLSSLLKIVAVNVICKSVDAMNPNKIFERFPMAWKLLSESVYCVDKLNSREQLNRLNLDSSQIKILRWKTWICFNDLTSNFNWISNILWEDCWSIHALMNRCLICKLNLYCFRVSHFFGDTRRLAD